jgi:arabinogalactan oligomer / maltooligosaccharide transport system permease protein
LKTSQFNMSTQWGLYSASALLVSLPVLILFFVLSQLLISGLNFGAEQHYGVERVRDSRAA